jgi:UDP-GlcNAc:undecaprenyl-phosphate GlcNAc-1-phosphate transferase
MERSESKVKGRMPEITPATCLALALAGGTLGTALSAVAWKKLYLRRRWMDEPGPRKIHVEPTALSGGAAVLTGFLTAIVLLMTALFVAPPMASSPADLAPRQMPVLALGAVAMFLLGFWDDVRELRPPVKFVGQIVVAAATVGFGIRLPLLLEWPLAQWALTVFILVLCLNAVNFLDNMNGLCAGLGTIATGSLCLLGLVENRPLLAAACLGAAGSFAAFIPFNYPRASVFLGDAGSHVVGYLTVVLALSACGPASSSSASVHSMAPLLVLLVPLWDIVQVVAVRIWRRRPFYLGDTNHVSHQLVRAGASPTVAVLLLWGVAIGAGALAVLWAAR